MKNINIGIMSLCTLCIIVIMTSCQGNCRQEPNLKYNTVDKISKINLLNVSKVEVEVQEGHSHAPDGDLQKIGSVMWSSEFGGGYFHGNPYNESMKFPMKRNQKKSYIVDKKGDITQENKDDGQFFNIFSTTPKDDYLSGVFYALIVRLYDNKGNRIDNELRKLDMQNRVQVFYEVVDEKPSFSKYKLPMDYKKTDICYFWYYDRMPSEYDEYGDYITNSAVGFRGVFISLEPYTTFKLRMFVTILPKGHEKSKVLRNSISPSTEQLKNISFTIDIPIRVVTRYPDISDDAEKLMGKDFYEMKTDEDFDKYNKIIDDLYLKYYEDIRDVFPMYSVDKLKELDKQRDLVPGESSQFYL